MNSSDFIVTDERKVFLSALNDEAKRVFANQTNNSIYQYLVPTPASPSSYLYDTIRLLAILKIKSADPNPCQKLMLIETVPVKFFGITCLSHDLDEARNKLINAINDMAANKWLVASLCGLGVLELTDNSTVQKYIIFSYLAPYAQHISDIDATYGWLQFIEGSTPSEFKR